MLRVRSKGPSEPRTAIKITPNIEIIREVGSLGEMSYSMLRNTGVKNSAEPSPAMIPAATAKRNGREASVITRERDAPTAKWIASSRRRCVTKRAANP